MLINKLLTDAGFIILRTIDPKEIKYFIDLGCTPIVGYVSYVEDIPYYEGVILVYSTDNDYQLNSYIRPLPVFYIKRFLQHLGDFLQIKSYIEGTVDFRTIVERVLSYTVLISRDLL